MVAGLFTGGWHGQEHALRRNVIGVRPCLSFTSQLGAGGGEQLDHRIEAAVGGAVDGGEALRVHRVHVVAALEAQPGGVQELLLGAAVGLRDAPS
jgi:hypothetical protein